MNIYLPVPRSLARWLDLGRLNTRNSGYRRGAGGAVAESSNPLADAAMDRYAAGDDRAFEDLYTALCPRLYRYALRLVHHPARAEDLVQQTLEKMLRRRGHFRPGARVTPWAFAILLNLVRDQAKRPKLELLSTDGADDESSSSCPDPQVCTEAKQLQDLVRAALERLAPLQRQAFELVYYGEMSHAEAAEVLDTTLPSIKSRIQRAHEVLREALQTARDGGTP